MSDPTPTDPNPSDRPPSDRPPSDRTAFDQPPSDRETERAARATEAERRRRRDRVFGAVLADTTSDERGHGSTTDRSLDDELRRNVPPHHG